MDEFACMATFVQIVHSGSFAKAAKNLGISSAKVSTQINAIESRLGVQLLMRTTREVRLTAEGEAYHRHALVILKNVAAAHDEVSAMLDPTPHGRLLVGASTTILTHLILPTLENFSCLYPDIRIEARYIEKLHGSNHEDVDLMLRLGPLRDSTMKAAPLGPYSNIVVGTPALIEKHGLPTRPEDLSNSPCVNFINPDTGMIGRWCLSRGKDQVYVDAGPGPAFADGEVRRMACLAGLGFWIGSRFSIEANLASGEVVHVLPEWKFMGPPLFLVYRSRSKAPPRVRAFVNHIVGIYPPHAEIVRPYLQ